MPEAEFFAFSQKIISRKAHIGQLCSLDIRDRITDHNEKFLLIG